MRTTYSHAFCEEVARAYALAYQRYLRGLMSNNKPITAENIDALSQPFFTGFRPHIPPEEVEEDVNPPKLEKIKARPHLGWNKATSIVFLTQINGEAAKDGHEVAIGTWDGERVTPLGYKDIQVCMFNNWFFSTRHCDVECNICFNKGKAVELTDEDCMLHQ